MEPNAQPDPRQLDAVEASLYNRMLRNAFAGFVKSAAIGAVIGLALGALAGGFNIMGIEPLSGALHGAMWLAGITGSFGAVAGIQSTRDTRRFFLMHENQGASPEQTTEHALVIQPQIAQQADDRFQKMVGEKPREPQAEAVRGV